MEWIESRWQWLVDTFGSDRIRSLPVILPTPEYFPDAYSETEDCARQMLNRIGHYMGVAEGRVELMVYFEQGNVLGIHGFSGTDGLYWDDQGRETIAVEISNLKNPGNLAAVLAHELGHVLLLGDKLIDAETEDHEPLTDLLTVCLGMGVITSNAAIVEYNDNTALTIRWVHSRRGYLSMPMYGYALACFAETRHEVRPAWEKSLRPDLRWYFQNAVRFRAKKDSISLEEFNKADVVRTENTLSFGEESEDQMHDSEDDNGTQESELAVTSMTAEELLNSYAGGQRNFRDQDLQGLHLNGAKLADCDFTRSDMSACKLENADLSGANMSDAYLPGAVLTGCNLVKARLTGANFRNADLRGANLESASIRDADFREANLEQANLSGCRYDRNSAFDGANIDQAKLDPSLKHHICGTLSFEAKLVVGIVSVVWKVGLATIVVVGISSIVQDVLRSTGIRWSFSAVFIAVACLAGLLALLVQLWIRRPGRLDVDGDNRDA